jgi:hypothetical protein
VHKQLASPVLVFSTIDEVLQNSSGEDFVIAAKVLRELVPERTAIVLASSLTQAEVDEARQRLGIHDPFICEFGATIVVPEDYFLIDLPNTRLAGGHYVFEIGRASRDDMACRQGAPTVPIDCVQFLSGLYECEWGALWTAGLIRSTSDEDWLHLVDYPVVVADDDAADGRIDVIDWAEAIVGVVHELAERTLDDELTTALRLRGDKNTVLSG